MTTTWDNLEAPSAFDGHLDYQPADEICGTWLNFAHDEDHHHCVCDREKGHDGQHRALIAYRLPIGYVSAPVWWGLKTMRDEGGRL